jgi:nucleotide-binding universal stress UspA family protein
VAARQGADLIAMTSHGRGGLPRVFYGSVAASVLQRVDRPLLLVRSRGHA